MGRGTHTGVHECSSFNAGGKKDEASSTQPLPSPSGSRDAGLQVQNT